MRYKLISCEVLARQIYHIAAFSPHIVDIGLVAKGLHNEPDVLRAELQRLIDEIQPGTYDAILLGYGLCSNSVAGLTCTHTQMIVPRAHDCITLYLGSKERYGEEFRTHPGTYWYTPDYIERGGSDSNSIALGVSDDDEDMAKVYREYVEKYGEDNADYLMEVMGAWKQYYDRAAYIDTEEMRLPDYTAKIRELAERRGWRMEKLSGSLVLLRDLLEGRWDEERYQLVPPGATLVPSYDAQVMRCGQP